MGLLYTFVAGAVAGLMLASVIVSKLRRPQPRLTLKLQLDGVDTLDQAAALILEQVAQWVPGNGAHAYWLNQEGTLLQLRASLAATGNPDVAPDYSGLVLEETPLVPLTLLASGRSPEPQLAGTKSERWLEIPFGPRLVVRILLTAQQRVNRGLLRQLKAAGEEYAALMLAIYQWFQAREAGLRVQTLEESTQLALDTTLRADKGIELLMKVGGQMLGARAQCALVSGIPEPLAESEDGRRFSGQLLSGELDSLLILPAGPDVVPGRDLGAMGQRYNSCVRVPLYLEGEPQGGFFYLLQEAVVLNSYQRAVLRTLGERAAQLAASQRQLAQASAGYLETLQVLVSAMDSLSPYSVGHSDRLARYARLTARELGMPEQQADAVALAAYLHDVGMIAIDPEIILKPGRLTEDEYEQVKLHAELSARLVSPIQDPEPIAPMVGSHHERWDGHGYPQGLKGEAIPPGARIIAVVDLFDAKTTGRSYRTPLPFAEALAQVVAAGGSHADPQVAAAFARALEQERQAAERDLPMARCWELKQLPEHICAGCPNRRAEIVRCWESPEILCTRHGDRCETCVVYTEVAARGLLSARGRGAKR